MANDTTRVSLRADLLEGLQKFIAHRDEPPVGRMSLDDAVNAVVEDWLMGQGYLPLPGETEAVETAIEAAEVPHG